MRPFLLLRFRRDCVDFALFSISLPNPRLLEGNVRALVNLASTLPETPFSYLSSQNFLRNIRPEVLLASETSGRCIDQPIPKSGLVPFPVTATS